jgi:3-oxoacyl-[acyl-carrier protein] reductase
MSLNGQVALVTGGSRGIGKGIVLALAQAGAKVVFVYRGSAEAASTLVAELTAQGHPVSAVQADVADPAAGPRIVEEVVASHGRIDILVNNAGIIRDGLFIGMEYDDWKAVLTTNLDSVYHFSRAAARVMIRQRYGRIINISSVAADYVNKGQCNYAASKGAINAFTRALAVELASRNVTVNAIAPGFIETDMSEAVRNKAGDLISKLIPMRRVGKPEDIAGVCVFLASAAAAYLTGQVITVDGGLSLGAASA